MLMGQAQLAMTILSTAAHSSQCFLAMKRCATKDHDFAWILQHPAPEHTRCCCRIGLVQTPCTPLVTRALCMLRTFKTTTKRNAEAAGAGLY